MKNHFLFSIVLLTMSTLFLSLKNPDLPKNGFYKTKADYLSGNLIEIKEVDKIYHVMQRYQIVYFDMQGEKQTVSLKDLAAKYWGFRMEEQDYKLWSDGKYEHYYYGIILTGKLCYYGKGGVTYETDKKGNTSVSAEMFLYSEGLDGEFHSFYDYKETKEIFDADLIEQMHDKKISPIEAIQIYNSRHPVEE